jgi:hypothetical protein
LLRRGIFGAPDSKAAFAAMAGELKVNQLQANKGMIIHLSELEMKFFDSPVQREAVPVAPVSPFALDKHSLENTKNKQEVVIDPSAFINRSKEAHLYKLLEYNARSISKLRRCTRCLLPETFPYIEFDHNGVCNYCNHYKPQDKVQPIENLKSLVEPYRSKDGIRIALSFQRSRDSTYSLHIV